MPLWVILSAATAMELGTFFGGYKVIKTLGVKITKLRPYQGFAAETGGGLMLAIFAVFGIPASATPAITGTIMGEVLQEENVMYAGKSVDKLYFHG